jgi:hypothetical protein
VAAELRVDTDVVERPRQNGDGDRAGLGAGGVIALEIPALNSGGNTNDEPDDNEHNDEPHDDSLVVEAGFSTVKDQQSSTAGWAERSAPCRGGGYQ